MKLEVTVTCGYASNSLKLSLDRAEFDGMPFPITVQEWRIREQLKEAVPAIQLIYASALSNKKENPEKANGQASGTLDVDEDTIRQLIEIVLSATV
ncbi:MAG: hypothetical protein ABI220_01125 [Candidatus Saccharimonadales bacterium]